MKDQLLVLLRLANINKPIYSNELEIKLETSGVEIRELIRELRREGHPIAACKQGYFYARDMSELKDTIEDLEGRETSLRITRKAMENCFSQQDQLSFI